MGKICWDFPLLGTGNESGSNIAAITMFKGAGVMDGLAREVCQNSLDAKNRELPEEIPVIVKFESFTIKKSNSDVFDGYEAAVKSCRKYWEKNSLKTDDLMQFVTSLEDAINTEEIPVLVMRDYNTTGLKGVNAKEGETSYWDLLVNTEGISIKDDKNSAGSYGIGKNAPFAYSSLNLVFYNTLALDGGRGFEGVTRLATTTREYNGEQRKTQPIGKYLYLEDQFTGRPILPSDGCALSHSDAFFRSDNEIGTDVAVFGFKETDYPEWEELIAIAVIKNFILALYNGKLEVEIKSERMEYKINKDTLPDLLCKSFKEKTELKHTRQILKTLTEPDICKEVTIAEKNDLTVYVKYSETFSQGLSRFRTTGMLINTTTVDALPHFSVVVIVNSVGERTLSETLRSAEPPQHTEWSAKNITDNRKLHNLAAKYIREIRKAVQLVLDECDPTDPSEILDAGLGTYLPDQSNEGLDSKGADGQVTDIKIQEITKYDGRILYDSSTVSGDKATGETSRNNAFKKGKKKRKKRKKERIPTVHPNKEGTREGVAEGEGKTRITIPKMTDHRTFYMSGNKYRLFVQSPENYNNVYISFYASRDDSSSDSDALEIKNYKVNSLPLATSKGAKVGPIELLKGDNIIHVEFMNHEIMAITPAFTMEVIK